MSTVNPRPQPGTPEQAVVDAALVVLERMGLSPADLASVPRQRPQVPTFAGYVPVVSASVSDGTRRAYGSYWNRIVEQWGDRRLDEPTPSDIRQLWRTSGRTRWPAVTPAAGAAPPQHLVAALRCLYKRAEEDGFISERDNPARKVAKPRRLPSTRRAVADTRLAEINQVAATRATTPNSTRSSCDCTQRPPAGSAARSRCAPRTWTASSAWSASGKRARRFAGSRFPRR